MTIPQGSSSLHDQTVAHRIRYSFATLAFVPNISTKRIVIMHKDVQIKFSTKIFTDRLYDGEQTMGT